jgi:hypothetical protein
VRLINYADHAWTTDFQNARQQLKDNPQLVERLYSMFDLDQPNDDDEEEEGAPEDGETTTDAADNASASESTDKDESKDKASSSESKSSDATDTSSEAEDKVSAVWNKMWKYNQTYKILTASAAEQSVWYVMDEVGSAIAHSDSPNFKCMPFLCLDTATAYSLLWPIQDVHKDDLVTRDFYPNGTHFIHSFTESNTSYQTKTINCSEQHTCWCGMKTLHWNSLKRHAKHTCHSFHPRLNSKNPLLHL